MNRHLLSPGRAIADFLLILKSIILINGSRHLPKPASNLSTVQTYFES